MSPSDLAAELVRRFEPLLARGWDLTIHVTHEEVEVEWLMDGDMNCPYLKEYDPDDFAPPENVEDARDRNLAVADMMIKAATEREGQSK